MNCRIIDVRHKEVINVKDGVRLGCVNDLLIDMKCARIVAIIIYGRPKCFGLFGREDDIIIKWEDIEIIGDDTILVKYNFQCKKKRKNRFLNRIFS